MMSDSAKIHNFPARPRIAFMSVTLHDQVVLITGGARRVGATIARRLHAAGARICVHYRASAADAEALVAELNARRAASAHAVSCDLLQRACLEGLVRETVDVFGRLDALVNNASSFYATPVGTITEEAWDDLIGTNLKAPLFLSQAAAPELQRRRGAIVNIVDIHADYPLANYLVYNAAKGGLAALTRSLARELGPEVRVNGVSPGPILWPDHGEWQDEAARARILETTALKRVGEPDDIARAVEFLIAGAPYVTGQILAVDGGRSVMLG